MTTTEWRSIGHNLYIKSAFSDASYDLWITDMYRSWHEHLNKKQIIHRANDNGLQIDLSDSNNLRIVLGHLQKSLQADDRINADTSQEEEYLVLAAEISLPKPLPVASWIFRPASCTPDEFREQVTGPLFDKIHKQEQSEIDLIQRLKDKDHVIERLLDQVAKVNVDISTIFPALAGHANARKGMSKDEAEALVPALAPFDSQAWQEEIRQGKFYRGHTGSKTVDTDHTEDEMDVEPSVISSIAPVSTKGLKKKIGGSKASTPPASEYWGLPESQNAHSNARSTVTLPAPLPALKARGLKKKIGGPKPPPTPEAEIQSPPPRAETPEIRPKGIKKTIGGRNAVGEDHQSGHLSDHIRSPPPISTQRSPVPDRSKTAYTADAHVEGEKSVEEEEAEAQRFADKKREALRREMEQKQAAPKPKKRKF